MIPVFVNSLPKSGTNLVKDCLEIVGMKHEWHFGARMINQPKWARILNRVRYAPLKRGYMVGIDMPVEVASHIVDRRTASPKEDRYITAHVGYTTGILKKVVNSGVVPILITRDPRAVVNSFVHYLEEASRHPLFDLFQNGTHLKNYHRVIDGVMHKGVHLQPIEARCQAVMPWINHPSTLHIRFEDLIGPAGGGTLESQQRAVCRIVTEVEVSDCTAEDVAENIFGRNNNTFRSGQIDAWKEEVPAAVTDILNEKTRSIRESWGYYD